MPFFDIEYRRPVVIPSVPQDRIAQTPWRLVKRFLAESMDSAMKDFKALQKDYFGYEPEIKTVRVSAEPTPEEELGALLWGIIYLTSVEE